VNDPTAGPSGVAARLDGAEISFAELDKKAASKLMRLRSQAYDARKQTLDQMIDERLLDAEATKRGVTKDDLLKAEVTAKVGEPTEDEAKAFWESNPRRAGGDFEKMKPRILDFLKKKKETELRQAFIGGLREKAGVEILLQPMKLEVPTGPNDPRRGSADAPVQIVAFSDFQCPYCSRVLDTLKQVETTYGEKVAVSFKNFPLPMHPDAPKAAEAGQCAADQGKFWEMHDKMFQNQQALKEEQLKGYATELGLDATAFGACLDSGKYKDEVVADHEAGEAVGVSGTPAFFVNGRFLNGALPFDQFKEAIDGELKAKGLL
jgi:protein-disulfide isomerase